MHQFQCTKCLNTCKAQEHSINKEEKKSPGTLHFHCARKSNMNRRQSGDARNRRTREPTFLCNGTSVYPKKPQCFVQILTFKSHPWCSSSNAICHLWLAKRNQDRKNLLKNKYPSSSFGAAVPLSLPYSTFLDSTLLNLYPYPTATLPLWCSSFNALVYSIRTFTLPYSILLISPLLYATLLCSTLLYPTQLYSISTIPLPHLYSLLCLYSTSTLLLLNLCLHLYLSPCKLLSTLRYSTPLYLYSTSTLPLLYYLHSTSTQVPTGHNDLWASENVTSWSLNAGANWTQWSLG